MVQCLVVGGVSFPQVKVPVPGQMFLVDMGTGLVGPIEQQGRVLEQVSGRVAIMLCSACVGG